MFSGWGIGISPRPSLLTLRGGISGPVPEGLSEAAANFGLRVRWVHVPEGAAVSFLDAKIDLWPLLAESPGRPEPLFISVPYVRLSYWVITPDGRPLP